MVLKLAGNNRSRTYTYLSRIVEDAHRLIFIDIPSLKNPKQLWSSVRNIPKGAKILVASPNSVLVLPVLFLFRKRPVLDAGWPLIDGVITSRREYGFLGFRIVKTYLIDFIAFHLSSIVFLESESQIDHVRKRFFINRRKLKLIYTGFDERRLSTSTKGFEFPQRSREDVFKIVFRGGNQPEAGLETLIDSLSFFSEETGIQFIIISKGFELLGHDRPNLRIINESLSDDELFGELIKSNLMLGQMSNHPRLHRTIPHKFFEAAFLKIPYVTSSIGTMDYFVKNKMVFGFEGGNPDSLKMAIHEVLTDERESLSRSMRLFEWYLENADQKLLSSKVNNFLIQG